MCYAWKRTCAPQSRPDRSWFLDQLYAVPDWLRNDEERQRFCQEDLVDMTPDELRLERRRVEGRLIYDDAPPSWLGQRLEAIDQRLRDVA